MSQDIVLKAIKALDGLPMNSTRLDRKMDSWIVTDIITALRQAGIVLVDAADVKIIADQWTGEIEGPDWDYVDMDRDDAILSRLKAALDPDATGTPGEGT